MSFIYPAHVGLAIRALRFALKDFRAAVDARATFDSLSATLARVREAAEALDRTAPGGDFLEGNRYLPRHLARAERLIGEQKYPDDDAADLSGRDLEHASKLVMAVTAESPRASIVRRVLATLEGPVVEFKREWPDQNRVLQRAIAALAPQGGTLLLGVANDGVPIGLPFERAGLDEKDRGLRAAAAAIDPPAQISTTWCVVDDALIVDVEVFPSGAPLHFVDGLPYIRDGSSTRKARAAEVERIILQHHRQGSSIRIEPGATSFIRTTDGQVIGAFAHIRVSNTGPTPVSIRGSVRFTSMAGEELHEEPMPVRWSSTPEPLSMVWTPDGIQAIPDNTKIPLGHQVEVAVGESEDAAIAIKFLGEDQAWGWNNKSYFHGGRHPMWPLTSGLISARVTVRAHGRDESATFVLDTGAPMAEFRARESEPVSISGSADHPTG